MTRHLWITCVFVCLSALMIAPQAYAEGRQPISSSPGRIGVNKKLGFGLQGGTVFGLSFKYFLTESQALQIALGASPYYGGGIDVDYLVHPFVLTQGNGVSIPVYFGVGAGVGRYNYGHDYDGFTVHIPVGIAFELEQFPLDFFVQVDPGVGFGRDYEGFAWGSTGGVRVWF